MMKIPPGTQGGRIFRLRGRGVSHLHDHGRGDQLVKVEIDVPAEVTADQKKALKELAESPKTTAGRWPDRFWRR